MYLISYTFTCFKKKFKSILSFISGKPLPETEEKKMSREFMEVYNENFLKKTKYQSQNQSHSDTHHNKRHFHTIQKRFYVKFDKLIELPLTLGKHSENAFKNVKQMNPVHIEQHFHNIIKYSKQGIKCPSDSLNFNLTMIIKNKYILFNMFISISI